MTKMIKFEYDNGDSFEIPDDIFVQAAASDLANFKAMKEQTANDPMFAFMDWDAQIALCEDKLRKAKKIYDSKQ